MRVLVCGSRGIDLKIVDKCRSLCNATLYELHETTPITNIIHGGAVGPDTWARNWAWANGVISTSYPPDWQKHGKPAGFIRNQQMVDTKPDLVVAFWDGKSNGTKHTIDISQKAGIPTKVINCE